MREALGHRAVGCLGGGRSAGRRAGIGGDRGVEARSLPGARVRSTAQHATQRNMQHNAAQHINTTTTTNTPLPPLVISPVAYLAEHAVARRDQVGRERVGRREDEVGRQRAAAGRAAAVADDADPAARTERGAGWVEWLVVFCVFCVFLYNPASRRHDSLPPPSKSLTPAAGQPRCRPHPGGKKSSRSSSSARWPP